MKIENKNFTEEELLNLAELQFVKYNFPNVNVSDHINHDNKLIISLNKEIDESIISNFLSIKFDVPIINQIIGHSQQHKEWENKNNLLINTSNNIQNFYTDYRKKDKDYDIINQYDLLLNYEGKNKFDYLLLTSVKKNKSGYSPDLLAKDLVGKVVVIDSLEKKLQEVKNMAQYKKIDYIVLKEDTEMKFGKSTIYYHNKKVRVKNKDSEFEIEVDN